MIWTKPKICPSARKVQVTGVSWGGDRGQRCRRAGGAGGRSDGLWGAIALRDRELGFAFGALQRWHSGTLPFSPRGHARRFACRGPIWPTAWPTTPCVAATFIRDQVQRRADFQGSFPPSGRQGPARVHGQWSRKSQARPASWLSLFDWRRSLQALIPMCVGSRPESRIV